MGYDEEELIEEIIRIVRQIKNSRCIRMLYGFAKGLKESVIAD